MSQWSPGNGVVVKWRKVFEMVVTWRMVCKIMVHVYEIHVVVCQIVVTWD